MIRSKSSDGQPMKILEMQEERKEERDQEKVRTGEDGGQGDKERSLRRTNEGN